MCPSCHPSIFNDFLVPTSAPQVPSGVATSSRSIVLSWNPPPVLERHGIIREYQINLTELQTGTELTYVTLDTTFEVSLLHPFYTYNWTVAAVTIGVGPYTIASTVVTLEDGKCFLSIKILVCL